MNRVPRGGIFSVRIWLLSTPAHQKYKTTLNTFGTSCENETQMQLARSATCLLRMLLIQRGWYPVLCSQTLIIMFPCSYNSCFSIICGPDTVAFLGQWQRTPFSWRRAFWHSDAAWTGHVAFGECFCFSLVRLNCNYQRYIIAIWSEALCVQ